MQISGLEHPLQDLGVVVGLIVSFLAFRRAGAADRRDREAILSIEPVWQGRRPPETVDLDRSPALLWNRAPYPHEPDDRWTVAVPYDCTPNDGVTIRAATSSDDLERDAENYTTWRVLVAVKNHGRAAAVDVTLRMRTVITTLGDYRMMNDASADPTVNVERIVTMQIKSVGLSEPRFIELRSMATLPTSIQFLDVSAGEQPTRLSAETLHFQPRA